MKPLYGEKEEFLGYALETHELVWDKDKGYWEKDPNLIVPEFPKLGENKKMSYLSAEEYEKIKNTTEYDEKGNVVIRVRSDEEIKGIADKLTSLFPDRKENSKVGYLKDKRVYLSGSITAASDDGQGWRKQISGRLESFGLKVDDPTVNVAGKMGEVGADKAYFKQLLKERKFKEAKEAFWPIARKDLRSVDLADFLIFYYDPDLPMFGTIDELVTASRLQKKPVLMFISPEKIDKMNIWSLVLIKGDCIFTSWEDMFDYLDKIDKNGPIGAQKSRWTL